MDPRRKVLVLDGLLGLAMLLAAVHSFDPTNGAAWALAGLSAVVAAGLMWGEEHGRVGEWAPVAAVVTVGIAVLGISLAGHSAFVSETAIPAGLAGFGVGILGYRFSFGVVRPVPERRLRGARERGV